MDKDYTGFVISASDDKHRMKIVRKWKENKPNSWYWKCLGCYKGAGVLTTTELEKLEARGLLIEPSADDPVEDELEEDISGYTLPYWGIGF
jgi:hypothetical protein